jgi:methylthioribulose-1-phosphate dehydratase
MMQTPAHTPGSTFREIAAKLAATAKALHARGWLSGTSGNLSAVVQTEPLLLAMSPSGVDKGELTAEQVLLVDEGAHVINTAPSRDSEATTSRCGAAHSFYLEYDLV